MFGIILGQPIRDGESPICAAVIDNDDLEILNRRREGLDPIV